MVQILEICFSLALKIDFFKVAGKITVLEELDDCFCFIIIYDLHAVINVYGEGGMLSMSMGREKCL